MVYIIEGMFGAGIHIIRVVGRASLMKFFFSRVAFTTISVNKRVKPLMLINVAKRVRT